MRLIDADAIIYDEREEGVLSVTEYDIDNMPTIEAIPISWIKERIKWCEENGQRKAAGIHATLLWEWDECNYLNKLKEKRENDNT